MHSQCFSNHNLGLHENVNQKQTHWKAAGGVRGGRAKEERSEAQQEMNREAQCARGLDDASGRGRGKTRLSDR